jgi:hypothetical protein
MADLHHGDGAAAAAAAAATDSMATRVGAPSEGDRGSDMPSAAAAAGAGGGGPLDGDQKRRAKDEKSVKDEVSQAQQPTVTPTPATTTATSTSGAPGSQQQHQHQEWEPPHQAQHKVDVHGKEQPPAAKPAAAPVVPPPLDVGQSFRAFGNLLKLDIEAEAKKFAAKIKARSPYCWQEKQSHDQLWGAMSPCTPHASRSFGASKRTVGMTPLILLAHPCVSASRCIEHAARRQG